MYVQLPPVQDKSMSLPHFPAAYQAVIFRNAGIVPVERIAKVIGTDVQTVCREAEKLGFDSVEADPAWQKKGYISIIRANWFLLDYDGLCTLLGWTIQQLSFTLREDDFLDVKLGRFKPSTPDVRIRPLTPDEEARTADIRSIVKEALDSLPADRVAPFDFTPGFNATDYAAQGRGFEERIVYSYCSLYGDTFTDRRLIDESFPDELLSAYQRLGITGVWTHIVLYQVTPFPFDPTISEGWEKRQEGMRYLTEKLAKYGIRLFFYFNEPRTMPEAFFTAHPELRGAVNGEISTMCIRHPDVQAYLYGGVKQLCENVPLLGGFFTITASENFTSCHSHNYPAPCPRCAAYSPAETYALVNTIVRDAVRSVSDSIRIIAWSWGWNPADAPEIIRLLPKDVAVMNVSEQGVKKLIGGTETSVLDYSISVEGPGEYAKDVWRRAHESGHRAYAKLQLNNSWEMSTVPFIPVLERTHRLLTRLIQAGESSPDGLLLSWTLGGYPSPTLALVSAFNAAEGSVPSLAEIYEKLYPGCDISAISEAIHLFSEAFEEYPFHISCAYSGPQQCAPANLLHPVPTGLSATMTGYPHDDMDGWRGIFPIDTYVSQLKKLSDMWNEGLGILRPACAGHETEPAIKLLSDCAEVCGCHFRSMYLQCMYVLARDGKADADIPAILAEEEAIARRVMLVQARNAAIGYESSNHYFYHTNALLEKLINCRYLSEK